MNDVLHNLALARRYKRRAVEALLPPVVPPRLRAIEAELRGLALDLLTAADPHGTAPTASEPRGGSRKIDLSE